MFFFKISKFTLPTMVFKIDIMPAFLCCLFYAQVVVVFDWKMTQLVLVHPCMRIRL